MFWVSGDSVFNVLNISPNISKPVLESTHSYPMDTRVFLVGLKQMEHETAACGILLRHGDNFTYVLFN
ncbi:hypothetical protein B7P43_G06440 [Cryptotermes secundus]|uniref:Uncharacterized protein n=1 Tax=Cryptotermes secundus TaxID=105785 RepID=A0A2J7PJX6_9NEOP|nr:hypothetical protein B7P43_G06440 [Cryptotermes secundus]